ncbi:MAG: cyclophilin-like fold protein [Candidatus Bathyarchaeia archaeon]
MLNLSASRIPIVFRLEDGREAEGELIRHLAPRTVSAIVKNLPIEGRCVVWMDEVYFKVPVTIGEEKATKRVERGDIAYWPMGSAICIFFGSTQPYSPVNPVGKIKRGIEVLEEIKSGLKIMVLKTEKPFN